jgi:hypothetical protein
LKSTLGQALVLPQTLWFNAHLAQPLRQALGPLPFLLSPLPFLLSPLPFLFSLLLFPFRRFRRRGRHFTGLIKVA